MPLSLGDTLEDQYDNFFKFFGDENRSIEEIEKFIKDYDIPSQLCLSSLQTSLWVLCLLEVCPYKPRGLSLLGQSVVG